MKEVEILVKVSSTRKKILSALERFKYVGSKKTLDIYYSGNTIKIKKLTTDWLRVRKKQDIAYITYKKDHYKGNEWIYSDEHEIKVDDFDTANTLLKNLGFEELVRIDMEKLTYLHKDYEIALEIVKGLGLFLEVERLDIGDEDPERVKDEIRRFVSGLGISSEELNIGKPELMLRKKMHKKE